MPEEQTGPPREAALSPEGAREDSGGRRRLAELVEKAGRLRGLRGLSEEELLEFGRLYRRAASHLAHARAHGLNASELEYLNWLVGRAYGLLYVTESAGLRSVGRFFASDLPQTFRRHGRVFLLSVALFLAPAVLAAALTALRPDLLELLNPQLAAQLHAIAERHSGNANWLPAQFRPIASSLIMTNNIRVSFLAFAGGILLGLLTVIELVYNGLVLGAIAGGVSHTPASVSFWAFVAPHGMVEIPAIWISATAGLLLGLAIIEPGPYSRVDALRLAGRQAVVLMLGVIVFLVFAALVEGFFSPAVAPPSVKFTAAALIAVAFWSYLLLAGRRRPATEPTGP